MGGWEARAETKGRAPARVPLDMVDGRSSSSRSAAQQQAAHRTLHLALYGAHCFFLLSALFSFSLRPPLSIVLVAPSFHLSWQMPCGGAGGTVGEGWVDGHPTPGSGNRAQPE